MNASLTYKDDAGDRIIAALREQKPLTQKRLAPAARLAGEQLEWLMPVAFAPTTTGLFTGKFTTAALGTILFILADERGVASVHVLDQPDLVDRVVERAQALRAFIAENGSGDMNAAVVSVIGVFVREYGGAPGADTRPATEQAASNMVGALFAGLTEDEARDTLGTAREISKHGYAPAFVALRGPGAKPGTTAGAWPLLLPLAPYLDTALLAAVDAGGRA